eukprot:3939689-Rhodomonas_salina.1
MFWVCVAGEVGVVFERGGCWRTGIVMMMRALCVCFVVVLLCGVATVDASCDADAYEVCATESMSEPMLGEMLENPQLGAGGAPCPNWPVLTCGGVTGGAGAVRGGPLALLALLGGCTVLTSGKRA